VRHVLLLLLLLLHQALSVLESLVLPGTDQLDVKVKAAVSICPKSFMHECVKQLRQQQQQQQQQLYGDVRMWCCAARRWMCSKTLDVKDKAAA
jgi:hypothetical protein